MTDQPKLTELQERERATWQYRAVAATQGQKTRLGAILLAVLRKNQRPDGTYYLPAFGPSAVITPDGVMISNFVDRHGVFHLGQPVGYANEVTDNFRGLADALKLSDEDRIELVDELRKWVVRDYSNETYEGYEIHN